MRESFVRVPKQRARCRSTQTRSVSEVRSAAGRFLAYASGWRGRFSHGQLVLAICVCCLFVGCYSKSHGPSAANGNDKAGSRYEGTLDKVETGRIAGWAWDINHPDQTISVDLYDDTVNLGTVVANRYREGLKKAGKGNGEHGFSLSLSSPLGTGRHVIRAVVTGTQDDLHNSPLDWDPTVAAAGALTETHAKLQGSDHRK